MMCNFEVMSDMCSESVYRWRVFGTEWATKLSGYKIPGFPNLEDFKKARSRKFFPEICNCGLLDFRVML
jgi:hypothetical protein